MVFQRGATSVAQNTQGDLTYEIAHLSSICAQPCVFTGPDAEAGALTYASVRVLLLRAIEQQENMSRLYEMVQNLNQETRTSISSCLEELSGLRNHVGTLQQNIHELYSALQSHGHRLDNLESITRSIGTIDSVLSSLEQRIQSNANAIGHLDQQQRDLALHMQGLPTSEMIERRMRELNDLFMQRLAMLERTVQDVQTQKADYNQVPSIVMSQLQTSLAPIETDVNALYNLWDLNKNDVHNTVRMGVQNRVQLVHSTPPFTTLMEMLRSPDLPTVTVGPAMMGGSTNISVTSSSFNENYGSLQLSPRTATTYQQQSSYLGIEVGPGSDSTNGVVVTRVLPGTPASAAGLRVGDILVAMNDRPFNTVSELVAVTRQCLAAKPAGGCYLAITRVAGTSHEKVNVWVP